VLARRVVAGRSVPSGVQMPPRGRRLAPANRASAKPRSCAARRR
jgi:hypothetical protein